MNNKIQLYHQQKLACIYLRQSTMYQVMHHQQSTERQYALEQKALQFGWDASLIRIMDGDLGQSGSSTTGRTDFKALVAEVSMGNVGAIFVMEASRLSRSSADWNRLLELCSLTQTLIIDQDGCYDPGQFNDQLLLGLKGTMSQAELHLIRARLHGAKLHKAQKGELRFPIPVGYIYDEDKNIVFDPDAQVQHAIQLAFSLFQESKSAYRVMQYFGKNKLQFPKRAYGGKWKGKLLWGTLSHSRLLHLLKHPFYAGVYTFGRYKSIKKISPDGEIITRLQRQPMDKWPVIIKDHHPQYISYPDYEKNIQQLQLNKTSKVLSGPPREGSTLLQGILVCGVCGKKMTIRYACNGKVVPTYQCNGRKNQGIASTSCLSFRADTVDPAIEKMIIEALTPANVSIAINAAGQLEKRHTSLNKHWEMNIQRCQYHADLAQRRFEQVDPANRLVAASLERNWNSELEKLSIATKEYQEYLDKQQETVNPFNQKEVLALAQQIPGLWSKTSAYKDKKRIIRLLISDITVTKGKQTKQLLLHIRWQSGVTQTIPVHLPPNIADQVRYPLQLVDKIRALTMKYADDRKTVAILNQQGILSATGKPFTEAMVEWVRFKHDITRPTLKTADEYTVPETAEMLNISIHMVYYWIKKKEIVARKKTDNTLLVRITPICKERLLTVIKNSCHAHTMVPRTHKSTNK